MHILLKYETKTVQVGRNLPDALKQFIHNRPIHFRGIRRTRTFRIVISALTRPSRQAFQSERNCIFLVFLIFIRLRRVYVLTTPSVTMDFILPQNGSDEMLDNA